MASAQKNALSFCPYVKKTPSMKIFIPMMIRIEPPKTEALPESFVPKVLPKSSPTAHKIKVTRAITRQQTSAISQSYSAMVKPTESASIEVATP